MATTKQIDANRENAQSSTGPVTSQGKANSSHNALKTGLTGQTVLLKTDDLAAYKLHLERFDKELQPATEKERALLQDLADTEWRLLRIMPLECGILALGRRELAHEFADETDPQVRESLIEAKVFLVYRRDLSNLSLQHTRLRRHREVVTLELNEAQKTRKETTRLQAKRAAEAFVQADAADWPCFHYRDFGFEFSLEQMFEAVAHIRSIRHDLAFPDVDRPFAMAETRAKYDEMQATQKETGGTDDCPTCQLARKAA